jgi:hypothetical protein
MDLNLDKKREQLTDSLLKNYAMQNIVSALCSLEQEWGR